MYSLNTALEFSSSIEAGANDSFKWFDFYTQSLLLSWGKFVFREEEMLRVVAFVLGLPACPGSVEARIPFSPLPS